MSEMGRCRFHSRLCADETVRGKSYSRRHTETRFQNPTDETRDIYPLDVCGDAFGVGLAAGPEVGLILSGEDRSAHIKSAVHVQYMTRDVRSHWRGEEERCIYDFAHITKPAERNLFNEILRHFVRHAFAHANVNKSRRDGIHRDVLTRKLARGDFRKRDDSRLARRVIRLPEEAHFAAYR